MTWTIAPASTAFAAFAEKWDGLNTSICRGNPMFDSRFVGALLARFGQGDERLCVHRNDHGIDGALILKPIGMGRWATFLPAQAQVSALLMRSSRPLETLFYALPGYAASIDLLAVDPEFGPFWDGFKLPRRTVLHAVTMTVELFSGFDSYWGARPKQLRKNLARYRRRAQSDLGPTSLDLITESDLIESALGRYAALEAGGWKGGAGTAVEVGTGQWHFYLDVLVSMAATGQAAIAELRIADRLAASRLLIRREGLWVILKTAYDESLASVAPGRQLLHDLLCELSSRPGGADVEFYTNVTRDQAEWATHLRPVVHQQIYRNDILAGAHTLVTYKKSTNPTPNDQAIQPMAIDAFHRIEEIPSDAIELMVASSRKNDEASPGWFSNIQSTVFPSDSGVRYYVARFNGRAMAVLPVRAHRTGFARHVDSLANYYTSLFEPALAAGAGALHLAAILERASRDIGTAHTIRFEPMDPDSLGYSALMAAVRSIGWLPFRFFCFGNWFLKVESCWKDYYRERDGMLRSTLKRKGKKFAAEGGHLEIVTDPVAAESAIQAYNDVYSRSWKKQEPYPEFIPGLIRRLAGEGKLRLGIARLKDRPIAAQIWIVSSGKAHIFKLAYDEAHAEIGAGTLLTAHLMEHVIDTDGVAEVDYLIGDDAHKQHWMGSRRERWGLVAYNPRSIVGCTLLLKEITGRALRKMTPSNATQAHEANFGVTWRIEPIGRFAEHSAAWDDLQASTTRIPFLESLFLLPLLEQFGTGREILVVGTRLGRWCAAAILTPSRTGVWETFQPSQLPLGAWISSPGVADAAQFNRLTRALPGFNLALNITQQDSLLVPRPDESPTVQTFDYIQTAWVEIDRPFDTYWEERGKNLRTNTRKQRVKLESEAVATTLDCITDPQHVAEAIRDYGALESSGWKGKDGTAVHADNAQGRFYRKMLENFCAVGRGRIYRYCFNGKPVAMDLCIESGDRIVILKTAYDESYKTVSPSTLMRQDEFRLLFHEPKLKRIEFYGKVMEWHTRWTENSRTIYHLTAYRWSWLAKLHDMRKRQRAAADAARPQSSAQPAPPIQSAAAKSET